MTSFKPGDAVILVRGISDLEKELIAKGNIRFTLKRVSRPHGYFVVGNESGDWHLNPEALELADATRAMKVPTIHLNGTSKDSLLDQVTEAGSAVYAAMGALANAAPNGRDYYPQGPGALKQAQDEHQNRMARLRSVYEELQQLAEAIEDQGK